MPIRTILIANRGEIALRIARTCREIGLRPAMVYSDADRNAPHTRAGDVAIPIGASYLDIARIIEAAEKIKAGAIHPGYGFLSENPDFADACAQSQILFIGPSADCIRKMGLKTTACQIAAGAGVPIVPRVELTDPHAQFPLRIKAAAGGGGRGMRIVKSFAEYADARESARNEAERAFGNGALFGERYIENARHIEFQIFGDNRGNLIHLFERECSIQRRHQKIIEEAPSPALNDDLRRRMGDAALAIGKAIGYTNAGTVEFLLGPSGDFYFIEVNTRIQVEHPVTELITGLDLVRLQIEIAEGKPLPSKPRMLGHAIEARLYAEDPANNFAPATGKIHAWRAPEHVRVDTALETGVDIGIHFDPMLAKIAAFGMDRETARRRLIYALQSTKILGVQTNRDYLIQILDTPEFREGRIHTAFLPVAEEHDEDEFVRIAAAVLYGDCPQRHIPANYRNNPYRDPRVKLRLRGQEIIVSWKQLSSREYSVASADRRYLCSVDNRADHQIAITVDGITHTCDVHETPTHLYIYSSTGQTTLERLPRYPRALSASLHQSANSPMPGQVLRILVQQGQHVKIGESLVVLEAMKMEQTIRTTINGVVQSVLVVPGQVVAPGQMLVEISAEENANE